MLSLPLQSEVSKRKMEDLSALHPNAEVTNASIHDLLAVSKTIISQNSAVGMEALMYKKPVITCAQSDYHHASLVSRHPQQLRNNLQSTASWSKTFPYEAYLFWFLDLNMLAPQSEVFLDHAWSRKHKTTSFCPC